MTQSTTSPATRSTHPAPGHGTVGGLRNLHLVRAAFSLVWVGLAFSTGDVASSDTPSLLVGALLVLYPLWDAAATLLERRWTGAGDLDRARIATVGLGSVAAVASLVAAFGSFGAAVAVFGVWALGSGALQLWVAIRRWRTLGAQWPMVISGVLSVGAGANFVLASGSVTAGLAQEAGYAAFGAFWFLVSAVALTLRLRRQQATPASR